MPTDSRAILTRLAREGWTVDRITASHRVPRYPGSRMTVAVPRPRKDLQVGTVGSVDRQAG